MHLTRYTDYALRVLIYLAVKGEERSTIHEIAESFGVSRNHLMKVVQDLSHRGYITTIRGKNGGLLLNRAPEEITLGALVRATEHELGLVECFRDSNDCVITPACRLKPILNEAMDAFMGVLDQYTLADMLGKRQPQLARLMQIATSSN
ncbi:Rrf2 family transcriptional regulator [Halomonas sp. MCCC 1A17488]|uniref:Rrf2 family transcriptional regulator n=1 Tax=Billgrantia sulfidoxydans TaxID=2733484 RepID=A0ABX7VY24_9GAMM|nr:MULTISPECIES: Rrf2 family transcriptional regulator [Halomonas]MCE8017095.1 Rrf2 family transcriptional regulator [Halomonas sp. MCCC 1A17488]MCG3240428.1 Rrf2 family transcriptional regulator [Halomonas sp. MCCC 1A17488]QPP49708.1 Rrf2 family transcriptional regulator [Halomonas sp. SS10-MC5]QTP53319.1 Rrf2 family transcriptional regulator [Halomonas sulfidoxydans]